MTTNQLAHLLSEIFTELPNDPSSIKTMDLLITQATVLKWADSNTNAAIILILARQKKINYGILIENLIPLIIMTLKIIIKNPFAFFGSIIDEIIVLLLFNYSARILFMGTKVEHRRKGFANKLLESINIRGPILVTTFNEYAARKIYPKYGFSEQHKWYNPFSKKTIYALIRLY